ncbi:hypothetical protein NQT62_01205 [Limnobacter humi]|uniref:Response regulator n=1 Tax=Limnobacter humi TaxID=1778671 RepID=A0ABT1WC12_9BURK|nr:hypothetical protein [Limnobacter humi]MCQ8895052.1 hypothetical protein [Limnobacter humi]
MKPVIFCLEDFEIHRSLLELNLRQLLGDTVTLYFFRSLAQLKACPMRCDVLVADLNVTDSPAENTAEFLKAFAAHTPVIVQSSDLDWPPRLEAEGHGNIVAAEKAGQGPRFEYTLQTWLQTIRRRQATQACEQGALLPNVNLRC